MLPSHRFLGAKQVTQPVALLQLSVELGQHVVEAPLPLTQYLSDESAQHLVPSDE